jgi:hypothetical protein
MILITSKKNEGKNLNWGKWSGEGNYPIRGKTGISPQKKREVIIRHKRKKEVKK